MSEAQARPAPTRGRGSGRGARGGFSSRGGRAPRGHAANGEKPSGPESGPEVVEDEGEIGQLKKQYGSKTGLIKEMFPDWSEVDILFALHETEGDENLTVTRIAEGSISQWGEVPKQKKDRAKPKTGASTLTETSGNNTKPSRGRAEGGGRGGGRGRVSERGGRVAGRGRVPSSTAANGTRSKELSVPTEESTAWDASSKTEEWGAESAPVATKTPPPAASIVTPAAPAPTKPAAKTWASMLRASTAPPKPAPKPKETPAPASKPMEVVEAEPVTPEPEAEPEAEPVVETAPEPQPEPAAEAPVVIEPEIILPPSKDQLTEENLEHVKDESNGPATETAASTAADSWDPRQIPVSATVTPLSVPKPALPSSGYVATALKATTERPSRTPSYNRRVLDQEEAVRMPGNREVDRAAVQFGAFNLGGDDDGDDGDVADDDIDGDREEAETRAQPPAESPVAHPRTSLPPVPQPAQVPEAFPGAPKTTTTAATTAAPTGPAAQVAPAAQQAPAAAQAAPTAPTTAPTVQPQPQPQPQQQQQFGSFGRGAAAVAAQDPSSRAPFDSFHPAPTGAASTAAQSQFENYQAQQAPLAASATAAAAAAGLNSGPADYSNYYGADQQGRSNAYANYYSSNQYGQHQQQQGGAGAGGQDSAGNVPTQPRAFGAAGYGASQQQSDGLSQYPQSNQSRYGAAAAMAGEVQNSGHTTPNPPGQTGAQQGAGQQSGAAQQAQQAQQHNQYPYQHPYFANQYYTYMGQHYPYHQGGYGGGPYGGKGNLYSQQQPHAAYGMQSPYDHSSSAGAGSGFGGAASVHRGDSGLGSSLVGSANDYGRTGSAQSGNQQVPTGAGGFGGMQHHDSFGGRGGGAASYQSQAAGQGFGGVQGGGQTGQGGVAAGLNDDLKPPYGDAKGAGPSPSLGGARPGSAANAAAMPPPQQQAGVGAGVYGSYQGHYGGHGLHSAGGGAGAGGGASGYGGGNHANNHPYGGYGGGQGGGGGGGGFGYYGGAGGVGAGASGGNQGGNQAGNQAGGGNQGGQRGGGGWERNYH